MIEEGAAYFITINLYKANNVTVTCENGWTPFTHTGQCYKLFRLGRNWPEARAYCQGHRTTGDLASIPDQETNELIMSLLPQSGTYWIGGTDAASEGAWQWSDGTPWVYTSAVQCSIVSTTGCTITEKAPTRAFSWLKAPISAFTFKTLC